MELQVNTYNAAVYGNKIATDVATINDGQWHHVAVTITLNTNVSFYVDGVATSVSPLKVTGAGSNYAWLLIGQAAYAPLGNYFNGSMDEVQIYSRALSASEIGGLYAGASATPDHAHAHANALPDSNARPNSDANTHSNSQPTGDAANRLDRALDVRRCRYQRHADVRHIRQWLHGKISGSVTQVPGISGDAYAFSTNGSINMGYASQTELNKNLTLAAWIKTTNSSRKEAFLAKYDTPWLWLCFEDHRCRQAGIGSRHLQRRRVRQQDRHRCGQDQ